MRDDATTEGAVFGYFALYSEIRLWRRWYITPAAGFGGYSEGNDKDLGGVFQFHLGADIAYRMDNGHRIGLKVAHISNAFIHDDNPGTEQVFVFLSREPMKQLTGFDRPVTRYETVVASVVDDLKQKIQSRDLVFEKDRTPAAAKGAPFVTMPTYSVTVDDVYDTDSFGRFVKYLGLASAFISSITAATAVLNCLRRP